MNSSYRFGQNKQRLADIYDIERPKIEELKIILQEEYGQDFSYKDTVQIAHGLVNYYRTLANGRTLLKGNLDEIT